MHMADALLSPAVGGVMWAVTAGAVVYCSKKVKEEAADWKIPLMGVLGAFVFTAQMINFTIPGTGSSGHLGGGLLLAILLGPHAAFLTIASVLTVQALFFADGGVLALGGNIFNLGVFPCFIAYPFVYKKLHSISTRSGLVAGAIISAIVGLQLGALGVVVQTVLSGVTELPFGSFALLVLSIHLAIGLVEGLATAGVVSFIRKARPDVLEKAASATSSGGIAAGKVLTGFLIAALLLGGVFSWFASEYPDGLEWSLSRVRSDNEIESPKDGIHSLFAAFQQKVSFLPDYDFKNTEEKSIKSASGNSTKKIKTGVTLSGILGGLLTLLFTVAVGFLVKVKKRRREPSSTKCKSVLI